MFEVNTSSIDNAVLIESVMSSSSRYFLIVLNVLILFVSVAGNSLVLYGLVDLELGCFNQYMPNIQPPV